LGGLGVLAGFGAGVGEGGVCGRLGEEGFGGEQELLGCKGRLGGGGGCLRRLGGGFRVGEWGFGLAGDAKGEEDHPDGEGAGDAQEEGGALEGGRCGGCRRGCVWDGCMCGEGGWAGGGLWGGHQVRLGSPKGLSERVGEGACVGVAVLGGFGERDVEGVADGCAVEGVGEEGWGCADVVADDARGALAWEEEVSREHEVADAGDGVDVGGGVDPWFAEGLLGGHEGGGAEDEPGLGELSPRLFGPALSDGLGDAEVEDFDDSSAAARVEPDVLGLEVAVDDAELVGLVECVEELEEEVERVLGIEGAFAFKELVEGLAVESLHGDEGQALCVGVGFVDADAVDGGGVLVAEGAGELCFAEEAVGDAGEEDDLGAEHLDGDPSVEQLLFGLKDDAEAPLSQLAQEGVLPVEDGAGFRER
jgi:hypothetical protein